MSDLVDLPLRIVGIDRSDEELAELGRNLRSEILFTDVADVQVATGGPAPSGAKAGEVLAFGALVVVLTPVIVKGVVDVVVSWLRRQPSDIEVVIGGERLKGSVSDEQHDAIVTAFLERLKVGPTEP